MKNIMETTDDILFQAKWCKWAWSRKPGFSASERRSNEKRNQLEISACHNGAMYVAGCSWRESCSRVYARMYYYKDGVKVTLREIKKLPKGLLWSPREVVE